MTICFKLKCPCGTILDMYGDDSGEWFIDDNVSNKHIDALLGFANSYDKLKNIEDKIQRAVRDAYLNAKDEKELEWNGKGANDPDGRFTRNAD